MHLIVSGNRISPDMGKGDRSFQKSQLTCWVSGYFRHASTGILFDDKAAEYALGLYQRGELINQAVELNGSFALVLCDEEKKNVYIVTDRLGSIPLYVGENAGKICISDEFWQVVRDCGFHRLNRVAVSQLLQFTYVLGTQTLIYGASEFPIHAVTTLDYAQKPVFSYRSYWSYRLSENVSASEDTLLDDLAGVLEKVFSLYSREIKDRQWQAGIPLSGGMDSRLIAFEMKQREVSATAYSYGTAGFADTVIAARVAGEIGMPYREVIWNDEKPWTGRPYDATVKTIGFTTRYSLGTGAFAILDADRGASGVFMPGHAGDFISGSHILDLNLLTYNHDTTALAVFTKHKRMINDELTSLFPWARENRMKVRDSFLDTLKSQNDPSHLSLTQRWDLEQRQRRLILRECEIYKLSGSRVMLPFWDYEVIDFFVNLPRKYLYNQYLYRRLMRERIYTGQYSVIGDINTPHGPVQPPKSVPVIPGRVAIASKLAGSMVHSMFKKPVTASTVPSPSDSYYNLWYQSPEFKDHFMKLLQDSAQCRRLFKTEVLNQLLERATADFIAEPLYSLATIAHPLFNDYE